MIFEVLPWSNTIEKPSIFSMIDNSMNFHSIRFIFQYLKSKCVAPQYIHKLQSFFIIRILGKLLNLSPGGPGETRFFVCQGL